MRSNYPITNEMMLSAIREKYHELDRPPKSTEVTRRILYAAAWRFGSWEKAVERATGMRAYRHRWSDEELLEILRRLWEKGKRFPVKDIRKMNKTLLITIIKRFGGIDEALERAVGSSCRILICKMIQGLTKQHSNDVSTYEIHHELQQLGIETSIKTISSYLTILLRQEFVRRRRIDSNTIWALTEKAMQLLAEYDKAHPEFHG